MLNQLGVSTIGHFTAGADLRTSQYRIVQLNSSGAVVLPTGQGIKALGVLLNTPNTGEMAEVGVFGLFEVVSNGAVSMAATGFNVTAAGTSGKAEQASSGDFILGTATEAAPADGGRFTVFVNPCPTPLA